MSDVVERLRKFSAAVPVPPAAKAMNDAADEIERLVGLAAFASPDMVKWLTDQVMRRDNVIEAMKSAGMEQITKAFTENRWIPVSERLPPEGDPVLAYWAGGKDGMACAMIRALSGKACWTPSDQWTEF